MRGARAARADRPVPPRAAADADVRAAAHAAGGDRQRDERRAGPARRSPTSTSYLGFVVPGTIIQGALLAGLTSGHGAGHRHRVRLLRPAARRARAPHEPRARAGWPGRSASPSCSRRSSCSSRCCSARATRAGSRRRRWRDRALAAITAVGHRRHRGRASRCAPARCRCCRASSRSSSCCCSRRPRSSRASCSRRSLRDLAAVQPAHLRRRGGARAAHRRPDRSATRWPGCSRPRRARGRHDRARDAARSRERLRHD